MQALREAIRDFARERDWEQYHSPKNLAIGLTIEAAELLELFLWRPEAESGRLSPAELGRLQEEIGDVMIHLVNLADKFRLDPLECAHEKLDLNRRKYPADIVRGSPKKYSEY